MPREIKVLGNAAQGRDDGGYARVAAKFAERPSGVEETDGYRELGTGQDLQVTRVYRVPWKQRMAFLEWALGYSYAQIELVGTQPFTVLRPYPIVRINPVETVEQDDGVRTISSGQVLLVALRRVIPAQDPDRPWLFGQRCELVQALGAWVEDPEPVRDAQGNVIDTGRIAYVDNSMGGSSGYAPRAAAGGDEGAISPVIDDGDSPLDGDDGGRDGDPARIDGQGGGEAPGEPPAQQLEPSRFYRDGYCLYRLTYAARDYTVATDADTAASGKGEMYRYLRRSEEFSLESLPINKLAQGGTHQLRFWEGPNGITGRVVPEAGAKQLRTAVLTYTWVDVPDRPWVAFAECLGRVNSEPFDGTGGAPLYLAGTLLCLPWRTKRTAGPTGRVQWEIAFRFAFRPEGWNRFPASDGRFYGATFTANSAGDRNGEPLYASADFRRLFDPPLPTDYFSGRQQGTI